MKIKKLKILGVPIYAHWSVAVLSLVIMVVHWRDLFYALIVLACYFGIILIHEAGHAYVAKRAGCKVLRIRLSALHGSCEYLPHYSDWENVKIFWGGVVAQFLLAICVLVLVLVFGWRKLYYVKAAASFLTYNNLLIALFNLLPIPGLDGYKAWSIVPMLRRRYQHPKPKWTIKKTRRPGEKD